MSRFDNFMKNDYWAKIYNNAPETVKEYYRRSWSIEETGTEEDDDAADAAFDKADEFRDTHFTKSDWEELIAQSCGRAKYEYKKQMKEHFPE